MHSEQAPYKLQVEPCSSHSDYHPLTPHSSIFTQQIIHRDIQDQLTKPGMCSVNTAGVAMFCNTTPTFCADYENIIFSGDFNGERPDSKCVFRGAQARRTVTVVCVGRELT